MLNSLLDDFIAVSAALLGEGGALVEIGKRGAWSSERAGASGGASFSFEALAIDTEMERKPSWMQGVLSQLSRRLGHGAVQPLPLRSFDLEQRWEAAFRLLQSGGNLGKVVIRISAPAGEASAGGQLLTGGTGGLGLLTARWLAASRGAPALVLASRSTSTWVAPSKHKTASPHATRHVASLTTAQLLAASRGVPAPAPLPAPVTTGPLRPGPSPQHRATNLMLPGIEALLPPAPHNKGAQLTSTRDLIEREVSRALPTPNP